MPTKNKQRAMRNFHNLPPGPFHVFNQKVVKGVTENEKDPILAAHPDLISSYLAASAKHNSVYHQARYRSILDIAERDVLQTQLVNFLDQIASLFEMAAIERPEALLTSGFDLAKERRSNTRTKRVESSFEGASAEVPKNNT